MMQYFSEARCIACDDLIDNGYLCESCLVQVKPSCLQEKSEAIDLITCAFSYEGPVQKLIQQFKYHGKKSYPQKLLASFVDHTQLQKMLFDVDMVIPVPISVWGLMKRTYNQSTLLADIICGKTDTTKIKLDIIKQRFWFQKHLTGLDRNARIKQVSNKFYLTKKYQALLKDKKILLVDDVVTTMATLNACAQLLKNAGATNVTAWALARRSL